MSLNGLDSVEVQEAYQAAVAEAGGWFLLKYTSRDSVELLGRGKGGVHEARAAIAKYEETSPLYGVIVYRRRKVLIKYTPEGTSRVLLARTAVHFQDIVEKYSPYEALLDLTSAEGLTDTSLAASFPLHTATPSGASSRLDEITEDGEDPGPLKTSSTDQPSTGSHFTSQRQRFIARMEQRGAMNRAAAPGIEPPPNTIPATSPTKTSVSQFLVRNDSGKPSITTLGSDSLASMTEYDPSDSSVRDTGSSMSTLEATKSDTTPSEPLQSAPREFTSDSSTLENNSRSRDITAVRPSTGLPRQSIDRASLSTRPSTASHPNYDDDLLSFLKPKVKLGPRPVAPGERTKRPTVAPVSSMPATYRHSMRKPEATSAPSQATNATAPPTSITALPTPPPIPNTPEYSPRPMSRGSIKSLPSHKSTAMTPDKIRLMKAVELRKRQMRKSNPQADKFVPPPDEEIPTVPKIPDQAPVQEAEEPQMVEKEAEPTVATEILREVPEEPVATSYNADSGIEMDYEKGDGQESKRGVEEMQTQPPIVEESSAMGVNSIEEAPEALTVDEPHVEADEPTEPATQVESAEPAPEETNTPPHRHSPELSIPGAFLDPASPESELEDPMAAKAPNSGEASVMTTQPVESIVEAADHSSSPTILPQEQSADVPEIVVAPGSRPTTPVKELSEKEETRSIRSEGEGSAVEDGASSIIDLDAFEMSPKRKNSDLARRRQGFVEPIHIDTETESTSEDEFMDEIQTATVQKAQPVTVSRSPIQELFQRRPNDSPSAADSLATPREVYIPSSKPLDTPTDNSTHAFETVNETPLTYRPTTDNGERHEGPVYMKRNVSNEISKRIQALAGSSNRDNISPGSRPLTPEISNAARNAIRTPVHSRNGSLKAFGRQSMRMNPAPSQSIVTNAPQVASAPVLTVQRDPLTNRESVSVTNRIVRSTPIDTAEAQDKTEPEPFSSPMQVSSPLGADHTPAKSPTTSPSHSQRIDTTALPSPSKRESTFLNSPTSTVSAASRSGSRMSNFSIPQKAIPSPTVDDFPPPPGTMSSVTSASNDENIAPKEGSRTSRFFKRMSNIGGKRRSGIQQASSSDVASMAAATSKDSKVEVQTIMPPAVVVGDLNVQFPDSLLWKRRIVSIDDTGQLVFALSSQATTERQKKPSGPAARRYPLAHFRMPFAPDLDRQELPNSIMLDFVDGATTLQVACEDTVTLIQVTHVLKTYWRAWNSAAVAAAAAGRE